MNNRVKQISMGIILLSLSSSIAATQDYENPKDILRVLHLFLSNKSFTADVASIVNSGCVWEDEWIWTGTGEEISEGVFEYGGGIKINYISESGARLQAQYSYSLLHGPSGQSIGYLSDIHPPIEEIDCS